VAAIAPAATTGETPRQGVSRRPVHLPSHAEDVDHDGDDSGSGSERAPSSHLPSPSSESAPPPRLFDPTKWSPTCRTFAEAVADSMPADGDLTTFKTVINVPFVVPKQFTHLAISNGKLHQLYNGDWVNPSAIAPLPLWCEEIHTTGFLNTRIKGTYTIRLAPRASS